MCGRMTLSTATWTNMAEELLATAAPETISYLRPRFNVAPTQMHPVVMAQSADVNQLIVAQWGFPGRKEGPLVINARSETVAEKPMFRGAVAKHRCIVLADGFIEWRKSGTGRQPYWFHRKAGLPVYFAGLYTPMGATAKESPARFVVLTTSPNHVVAPVHDRMPAVLGAQDALTWLAKPALELLRPAPDSWLFATAVSTRINNALYDDPACLEPNTNTREQLALF